MLGSRLPSYREYWHEFLISTSYTRCFLPSFNSSYFCYPCEVAICHRKVNTQSLDHGHLYITMHHGPTGLYFAKADYSLIATRKGLWISWLKENLGLSRTTTHCGSAAPRTIETCESALRFKQSCPAEQTQIQKQD